MKAQISLLDEIIVDNFAGGGGASTGIELATGRPVTIAINHAPAAILMHKTNHPYTEHLQASVWDVDPVKVCGGRPVGLAWFSPDCKHFSKAKGAALVDRNIRGLAWIVLRWAGTVRPRVIILENVEEFQTWGPVRKGKPIKSKSGQTFRKWLSQLKALGYEVEYRELVAADYGAPTSRKRFVLIARGDGQPIRWPERTHAPRDSEEVKSGRCQPWRSAAEIIDWTVPMYSIFATKAEIKARYGVNAVRPLADNTLRRIIRGVDKFTIKSDQPFIVLGDFMRDGKIIRDPKIGRDENGQPFIVPTGYGERKGQAPRVHDIDNPVPTVVSTCKQNLVEPVLQPFLAECNHSGAGHLAEVGKPIGMVTQKCTIGLCAPKLAPITLPNTCNSVGSPADQPVHTITTAGNQILAAANLFQYHTEQTEDARVSGLEAALPTVDGANRHGLVSAHLVEYFSTGRPLSLDEPLHTATSHDREALTAVHIQKYFGGVVGAEASEPLPTVTAIDHNALTAAHVVEFKGQDIGQRPDKPLRTITASAGEFAIAAVRTARYAPDAALGYWPEVRALLNKYCGYDLADDEILLLWVRGAWHYIHDIAMRMLTPRELYRAMGFPADYVIDRDYLGNPYPKNQQVARCGNAVCPAMAEALVRANLPEMCGREIRTMETLMEVMAI